MAVKRYSPERAHRYYLAHRERISVVNKKYNEENKTKKKAHTLVAKHVREGSMSVPGKCQMCDMENARLHAHHPDYSRPLDVIWVCPSCHFKPDFSFSNIARSFPFSHSGEQTLKPVSARVNSFSNLRKLLLRRNHRLLQFT